MNYYEYVCVDISLNEYMNENMYVLKCVCTNVSMSNNHIY